MIQHFPNVVFRLKAMLEELVYKKPLRHGHNVERLATELPLRTEEGRGRTIVALCPIWMEFMASTVGWLSEELWYSYRPPSSINNLQALHKTNNMQLNKLSSHK